ncbi:hypothetical protein CW304_29410 [Bacillus sp. UFRGS-B20]|nr:hypothetical protein CW304_29410 [Bacillus sp. UFRGS-B20]
MCYSFTNVTSGCCCTICCVLLQAFLYLSFNLVRADANLDCYRLLSDLFHVLMFLIEGSYFDCYHLRKFFASLFLIHQIIQSSSVYVRCPSWQL